MSRHEDDNENGGLMVEAGELRALFAPRRPDAVAFAAGIVKRLAAARNADAADEDATDAEPDAVMRDGSAPSRFGMRQLQDRAAGVLGVPALGSSSKSLLAILSLPFLLLVGVVVTFVHSFRRVDPSQYRNGPSTSARARQA